MTEFIKSSTKVWSKSIGDDGVTRLLSPGIMLTDLCVFNDSDHVVQIVASDGVNSHIIARIRPNSDWSFAYGGGWLLWDKAALYVYKNGTQGEVHVAIGYVKLPGRSYNMWRS